MADSPLSLPCLAQRSAWFPALGAAARARVLDTMREVRVPTGAALCRQGERPTAWYGTLEGLLKWSVGGADGRVASLGGLSVGSWFGEGTLLRGETHTADVIALRDSRVALIPRDTFEWLRTEDRAFADFLLRQINERMHWFLGSFAAYHLLDTDSNVARALVGLFHPWLHPGSDPRLRVTQEEIAHLSGVSRQRCNAALGRLAAEGMIEIEYGGITVTDLPALQRRMAG